MAKILLMRNKREWWVDIEKLDFEQNYFAIDDPYGDCDFRLLHLQNNLIKDITPNGVFYESYDEADAALKSIQKEMEQLPKNKADAVLSYKVNGRAQLKSILAAKDFQKWRVIAFKNKTQSLFHRINGRGPEEIEELVWDYIQSVINKYDMDIRIVDVVIAGSRCRGLERKDSDLDVVVEYEGKEREDDVFNILKIGRAHV